MSQIAVDCNLDSDAADRARALHRVVRAMHDGHCPSCGFLADATAFIVDRDTIAERHECPKCMFHIFRWQAELALAEFRPFLNKSVDIFEQWRDSLSG